MIHDIRYAVRTLLRTRGFAAVAIATLAIGIGATTTIFSVVSGVLMAPLPYRDSGRLANIWVDLGVGNQSLPAVSPGDFKDYQQRATLFDGFAAASGSGVIGATGALTGDGQTERVDVIPVTANFFSLLGVDPILGRHFTEQEEATGGPQVVLLSYGLWQRRYGADRTLVGRTIRLDGVDNTVVGVMPRDFSLLLPAEAFQVTDAQIWKPLRFNYGRLPPRNFTFFTVFARLKAGVTFDQAQREMDGIAQQLRAEHAEHESSDMRIRVVPLQQDIVKHAAPVLVALLGAVACVLLIACANVAHLLLARSTSREREVAVRGALGAGVWRIVRQLATESAVLAAVGGALGVGLAYVGIAALRWANPANLPRVDEIGIGAPVLLFALAVTAATAVLFGLAPAIRAARLDFNRTLRSGASPSAAPAQLRFRGALVVAEFALALVLLVGAGLMIRSFAALQQARPGFDADPVLSVRFALPLASYRGSEARLAFLDRVEAQLESLPGVTAVGFTSQLPLTGSGPLQPYAYDEATARQWESATSDRRGVSPRYFDAMGTRLVAGRVFDAHDTGQPARIVIDTTLAARAWPGENAVGKRLQVQPAGTPGDLYADVIGVVEHMRILDLTRDVRPQIWVPLPALLPATVYAVVRTDGDAAALVQPVRRAFAAIDPEVPLDRVRPMASYVEDGLAQARLSLALMSLFGGVALLLAVVGIYGVMSYSVGQRTREIGIRIALGEEPGRVRNFVLVQSLRLIAPSVVLGVLAARALSRFLATLLYETDPLDAGTIAAMAAVLTIAAIAGCYVPARRATGVNPMVVLKAE